MFAEKILLFEMAIEAREEEIKSAKEDLVILRKKLKGVVELEAKAKELGVIE